MKATDFRIGNWVNYNGKQYQIYGISNEYPFLDTIAFGAGVVEWKDIEPIKLTEEVLARCKGVEIAKQKQYRLDTRLFVVRENKIFDYGSNTQLDYLHELQNLIYSLSKTELEYDQA